MVSTLMETPFQEFIQQYYFRLKLIILLVQYDLGNFKNKNEAQLF